MMFSTRVSQRMEATALAATVVLTLMIAAPRARAGSTPLALSTSELHFHARNATAPLAPQSVRIVSNGDPRSCQASVGYMSVAAGWLSATIDPAATPAVLTANVTATHLADGFYMGYLRVACGPGAEALATVTLKVGGEEALQGPAGTDPISGPRPPAQARRNETAVSVSPLEVNLQAPLGAGLQTALVSITSASGAQGFQVYIFGGLWLDATPGDGVTPATVTVSANPARLSQPGTYTGTITIVSLPYREETPVKVTFVYGSGGGGGGGGGGTLTAAPNSLTFSQTAGGTAPAPQNVSIGHSTAGTSITAGASAAWLTVTPTSGATPANLSVGINSAGLSPGTYQGSINVTAGSTSISVPVTFTLSPPAATLTASPTALSFSQTLGGAAPASKSLNITASTGTVSVTSSSSATWLTITPATTNTPAALSVSASATGLAAGTYQTTLNVTAGTASVSIPVTFTVAPSVPSTLSASPASLTFTQALTGSAPAAQSLAVTDSAGVKNISVSSNAAWLSVTPSTASTPAALAVSASAAGLTAGTYQGVLTITAGTTSITVVVTFNVTPAVPPTTSATPASLVFNHTLGSAPPAAQTVRVEDTNGRTLFTATPQASWLLVRPPTAATPADLTVYVVPAGLAAGLFQTSIVIDGGAAPISVPVTLNVSTTAPTIAANPASLTFSQVLGGTVPGPRTVRVEGFGGSSSFTANSDQAWMKVTPGSGTMPVDLTVTVNTTGMTAGVYVASVKVETTTASLAIPLTLTVAAPAIQAQPATISFTATAGGASPGPQPVTVSSTGNPFGFSTGVSTADKGTWLTISSSGTTTPASLLVSVSTTGLVAGTYHGFISLTPTDSTVSPQAINVTLTVAPVVLPPVVVRSLVNAASLQPGAIAPGEIVSIFGSGLGPEKGVGPTVSAGGVVASVAGGTRVLFDGLPAPLLYVRSDQINAIVPYALAGRAAAALVVEASSSRGDPIQLRVDNTAPAIFTADGYGSGQGAIINQDGTVNSPLLPALRESIVAIYGTGEGQTRPPGQDGRVISTDLRSPAAPVAVTVGGVPVEVRYAGSAPSTVSGVYQINVYLPKNVPVGGNVPVEVSIGGVLSQYGVTMAVK